MGPNERLLLIADELGIKLGTLAKNIDRKPQVLYDIRDGTVKTISLEIATDLIKVYPKFNLDWIIEGKGEMLRKDENLTEKEVILLGKHSPGKRHIEGWKGLPMYNVPITASFVESYRDEGEVEPQYYLYDPRFKDCDFGAIITGDSMHSEIRHGDFVACKEIVDKRFIVFGDIYYIVSTNGLETCKYINAGKDDDHLCLQAKNEKISQMQIPKEMVLRLYKVRGIVRGY